VAMLFGGDSDDDDSILGDESDVRSGPVWSGFWPSKALDRDRNRS
jgi:hypothetical protein